MAKQETIGLIDESLRWSGTLSNAVPNVQALNAAQFKVVIPRDVDGGDGWTASSIIPLMVIGHSTLDEDQWSEWLNGLMPSNEGSAAHGALANRALSKGLDLREMSPHGVLGPVMRTMAPQMAAQIANFVEVMDVADKWPEFASQIAIEFGGKQMDLGELIGELKTRLIPDLSDSGKTPETLGDLLGKKSYIQGGPGWS